MGTPTPDIHRKLQVSNRYLQLPKLCFQPCQPLPVVAPQWVAFNQELARTLALPRDFWLSEIGLGLCSGNALPDWAQPVAQAYAGHQFGHFNPQLGDGRAHLIAELTDHEGQTFDLQLKGSGRTPYSRGGDGRSPLGPVLREYIASEFMHRIGIPTTRALAAVATGELVYRDQAEPGGILTRVAASHLRVGSFEYVMVRGDFEALAELADAAIARHYPQLESRSEDDSSACEDGVNRYLALLDAVIGRQATLVAQWMSVGFIHGVMNTDNTSISGETIDYGPCAFMESYRADQTFSFIDKRGRYAYNQQPAILHWNMARLAEALLPLIDNDKRHATELAVALIDAVPARIEAAWLQEMGRKLGLEHAQASDRPLIEAFLALLESQGIDFTLGFRNLSVELTNQATSQPLYHGDSNGQLFHEWRNRWQQRVQQEAYTIAAIKTRMSATNPLYIPRNHLIAEVIEAAYSTGELAPFNALMEALSEPFIEREEFAQFALPAAAEQQVTTTFCGT